LRIFPFRRRAEKRTDELTQRVRALEREVAEIKRICREQFPGVPPVVVEKLCVDKICVDRLEFTNNLGALGIRELSGNLNIGANYGAWPGKKGNTEHSSGAPESSGARSNGGRATSAPFSGGGSDHRAGKGAGRPSGAAGTPPEGRSPGPSAPAADRGGAERPGGGSPVPSGEAEGAVGSGRVAAAARSTVKVNFKPKGAL